MTIGLKNKKAFQENLIIENRETIFEKEDWDRVLTLFHIKMILSSQSTRVKSYAENIVNYYRKSI